jgi:hypothetical protein
VRVFGSWMISLFRDLSYTGASCTFVKSAPDIGNSG